MLCVFNKCWLILPTSWRAPHLRLFEPECENKAPSQPARKSGFTKHSGRANPWQCACARPWEYKTPPRVPRPPGAHSLVRKQDNVRTSLLTNAGVGAEPCGRPTVLPASQRTRARTLPAHNKTPPGKHRLLTTLFTGTLAAGVLA